MSGLKSLQSIVNSLTKEEKKVCTTFLSALDSRGQNAAQKSIKLFKLLTSSEEYKENELEFLLYGKKSNGAFDRLVLRMRDKIIETLTFEVNIHRKGAYSERGRAIHDCKRYLSAGQILHSKGLLTLAEYYFTEVIEMGKAFELYDDLIVGLRFRRNIRGTIGGAKEVAKHESEIAHYTKCREVLMLSETYFNELMADAHFHANTRISIELWKERIDYLSSLNETINSANVAYYKNYIEIHYLQCFKVFSKVNTILNRQRQLLENSAAVSNPTRKALLLLQISENEIMRHRFSYAKSFCEKSFALLKTKGFNYSQGLIHYFFCLFYLGEYEKCKSTLELIYSNAEQNEIQIGKIKYLDACLMFAVGEYDMVYRLLGEATTIDKDVAGWNLSVRLLLVMTDIETAHIESADNRIVTLKSRLQTLKSEQHEVPKRIGIICEVLHELERQSYDFKKTYSSRSTLIESLVNDTDEVKWRPLTPELIPFHEWFKAKRLKIDSVIFQNYPAYSEVYLRKT